MSSLAIQPACCIRPLVGRRVLACDRLIPWFSPRPRPHFAWHQPPRVPASSVLPFDLRLASLNAQIRAAGIDAPGTIDAYA